MFWPCFNPNSEAGVDGIAQRLDAQGVAPTKAVLNCNTAEEAQRPERQSAAARPPLQLRSSGLRFQFGTLKRGPILPRSVPAEYRDRWIGGLWQYLENHEIPETHEKELFSCVLCISWLFLCIRGGDLIQDGSLPCRARRKRWQINERMNRIVTMKDFKRFYAATLGGRCAVAVAVALALAPLAAGAADSAVFRPGEVWNDTAGKPINAHGGGILFHEGTYYWYGENKEGRTRVSEADRKSVV